MITVRKLARLPLGTRHRKCASLIGDLIRGWLEGRRFERVYLKALLNLIHEDTFWAASIRTAAVSLSNDLKDQGDLRDWDNLRHSLLEALGMTVAEWDLQAPGDWPALQAGRPFRVYLDDLRSPFNVGSIIRTATAFGMERIWCSPGTTSPQNPRAIRSSMGALDMMNWSARDLDGLDSLETGPIFALELGGTDIANFNFPREGTIILGSEELGVSPRALGRANAGVVSIPLMGAKTSLNVGVAFGILAQAWTLSQKKGHRHNR